MRRGQIEKICSIGSFFASPLDATAPFCHENYLPQKLQNVAKTSRWMAKTKAWSQSCTDYWEKGQATIAAPKQWHSKHGGLDQLICNMLGPVTRPTPMAVTPPMAWNMCSHLCWLCSICMCTMASTPCSKNPRSKLLTWQLQMQKQWCDPCSSVNVNHQLLTQMFNDQIMMWAAGCTSITWKATSQPNPQVLPLDQGNDRWLKKMKSDTSSTSWSSLTSWVSLELLIVVLFLTLFHQWPWPMMVMPPQAC